MNKNNVLFSVLSFSILAINSVFLAWFIFDSIRVINKTIIFQSYHFILLICVIILNALYLGFIIFKLVKNNSIKKQKMKNIK